jgi:prepilin-type N-terminal cleavage/methylation domain-containing protein
MMFRNNKGVTLIELLAALSLLSIIIVLASSVHIFGQKQTNDQTTEIQNQANVRLAMKIMTKEIRGAQSVTYNSSTKELAINKSNTTDIYKFANNILTKNNQPLFSNLQSCTFVPDSNKVTITITSNSASSITLKATIYFRK